MNYLQFDFDIDNSAQKETLVALLAYHGFEGFEEEEDSLSAFIPENRFSQEEFSSVIDRLDTVSYTRTILENINWNKRWEENFNPVLINDFVAVRAGFHAPVAGVQHEIIITPKMSFGTGHHATTYLMMLQMQGLDFAGQNVLDFGTGTGVLAILAAKLGARQLKAIDYDEWSIRNATENVAQNNCNNITVEESDCIPAGAQFNIILANINLNVILANLPGIVNACLKDTRVLLSGFLKENEDQLKTAISTVGLAHLSTFQRGDWIAVLAKKT